MAKKKPKGRKKGHIPNAILEKRLYKLNRIVKSYGGKGYVEILESGRGRKGKKSKKG